MDAVNADDPAATGCIAELTELALDLRGTWEHSADELWGRLDPNSGS